MASRPPTPAATASPGSHDLAPRAPQWTVGTPWRHSHAKIVPPRPHLHAVAVTGRRSHQPGMGGGDLAHLGHYNSRQPRRHQKFRPPHHPHGPWRGSYARRIFFFFHWREKSTADGKNCLFFGFLCFLVFLVRIARFGIRKVFFMEFLHPAVHTFSGVVLDPKKL